MKITANAKINLVLDVLKKRDDGYHDVHMVMQTLELCDDIYIEKSDNGITVNGNSDILTYGKENLAYKAANLFFENSKVCSGAKIYIEKNIPICAGLAGGSSDAAAVLLGLNEIFEFPIDHNKLVKLGATLGADVPFCMIKGTAAATGIGDIITPIKPFGKQTVLIVKPDIQISTPWAYKNLKLDTVCHPDTNAVIKCIEEKNTALLYSLMGNVFESLAFQKYPIIYDIKNEMKKCGANVSLMSGSGPTVFGIFENKVFAQNAYINFKSKFKETILTDSYNV